MMDSGREANKGDAVLTQDSWKHPNYFTKKNKTGFAHSNTLQKIPLNYTELHSSLCCLFVSKSSMLGKEPWINPMCIHNWSFWGSSLLLSKIIPKVQLLKFFFRQLLTLFPKVTEQVRPQMKTYLKLACLRLPCRFLSHMSCWCICYEKRESEGRSQEEIMAANCCRWIPVLSILVCKEKQTSS